MSHYAKAKRKMGDDKVAEMHRLNENQPWRARCWNCRTWNEAPRQSLKCCNACGVNLWKRDGKTS